MNFDISADGKSFQESYEFEDLNAAYAKHKELFDLHAKGARKVDDRSIIKDPNGPSRTFSSYDSNEYFKKL